MSALLEVSNLTAGYGAVTVLHGIDLTVGEGEVLAVLGANGAGKTTSLRAISGTVRRRGRVVFAGRDVGAERPAAIARLGLGHVPQGRGTFAELTVDENLALGAARRRDRAAVGADRERVTRLFPRLAERRAQRAGSLSGGEQQMLAVARALMARPRLLLLDEPSLGLAPIVSAEVFAALAALRADGLTLVVVEQNAQLSLPLADRAIVLESGRVAAAGDPRQLLGDDRIRRAYLGD